MKNTRQSFTRRDLIKGTVAAVASAPLFIPAGALGRDGNVAPSERVTIGHIGVGGRGTALFRAFRTVATCQSVAVADCFAKKREAISAACKGKAYQDFRDLLARDDIDAVVIATPDHWHVPIGIMAARQGKDVYIEKPLGVTIEQDLAMARVIKETGRIFQYGTQQRSMRHCWNGCELVRRGAIGKVHTIEVDAPNGGTGGSTKEAPLPEGFDFEMWCGPSPLRPYTTDLCHPQGTYWVYDYSIGYLGGWGAHPLDIMVWGCTADQTGLIVVEGTGVVPSKGLYDTVYNWDMKIKFGDVDVVFKPGADRTKFIGDDGWIQIARNRNRNGASNAALNPAKLAKPLDRNQDSLQQSSHHQRNFVEAVKTRKTPVSNIGDAVRSDLISLLCDIAVRTGEKITWDPKKHELVEPSPKAAAMLTRPMRAPWSL